jgi:hypothetical protein
MRLCAPRPRSTCAASSADMSVYEKSLLTFLGCDLLLAMIAIPLMLRKVRRNVVYGFRTRLTLSDDAVWYEANAHFGWRLFLASLASAAAIVNLFRSDLAPAAFLAASIAALVAPLFIAILATARVVRSLGSSR